MIYNVSRHQVSLGCETKQDNALENALLVLKKRISQNKLPSPPREVKHYLDFLEIFSFTVNGSDLDSVTLKTYKVKDCERNLGSDDCI